MKAVLLWMLLVTLCLSVRVAAAEIPAGLPELEMRSAIEREAAEIYAGGDLGALSARSAAYVDGTERTSSGLWVSGTLSKAYGARAEIPGVQGGDSLQTSAVLRNAGRV